MADFEFTMSLLGRAGSPGTPQLLAGEVPVAGANPKAMREKDTDATTEAMLALKYDVGEMSIGSFTKARDDGIPLVALPIFFARMFPQRGVFVRPSANIKEPKDLRGKRVGVRQFWMSASIWHRLVLRQEYGVTMDQINWTTCQPERLESMKLPPTAQRTKRENIVPPELFETGDVDAVLVPGGGAPNGAVSIFGDPIAIQVDYYKRTGIYPTHHIVAMKEELAKREPWLVESLCNAFQQAKEVARNESVKDSGYVNEAQFPGQPIVGLSPEETEKLLGPDLLPYGVAANRKTLQAFLEDGKVQGLNTRGLTVDDLFAPGLPAGFR